MTTASKRPPRNAQRRGTAKHRRAKACLHCRKRRLWLRLGLCWRCYGDPEIAGLPWPPPGSAAALERAAGADMPAAQALPCPGALPGVAGSPQRLLALALRADAKQELFPELPRWALGAVARLFGVREAVRGSVQQRRAAKVMPVILNDNGQREWDDD